MLYRLINITLATIVGFGFGSSDIRAEPSDQGDITAANTQPSPWFPIFFYTGETGLAAGAGYMHGFDSENSERSRPNNITAMLIYTLKNQTIARLTPEFYFDRDLYNLRADATFSNMPSVYFGTSESSATSSNGERYTMRQSRVLTTFTRKVISEFKTGIAINLERSDILSKQTAGLLDNLNLVGSNGGFANSIGVIGEYDSRNHLFWPSSGHWTQLKWDQYQHALGSDFAFRQFSFDARQYWSITETQIISSRVYGLSSMGDVPFFKLGMLGGNAMNRGLYEGRYRNRQLLSVDLEHRFPISGRWNGVLFSGMGTVAPTLQDLTQTPLKITGGVGFRFAIDIKHKMNLRIDLGFSKDGFAPIVYLKEAF